MHEVLAFINAYISETEKLEDITVPMQNLRVSKWESPEGDNVRCLVSSTVK